jgi:hypothetical protein
MKRAIVVMATILILTGGQAVAEGLTPPRQSLAFVVPCHCTCLEAGCCPKVDCGDDELGAADRISPNTARPKLFARTTNRYSTPIPGATP